MKNLLKPIAVNEASYDVALLHKTLEVLGLPVSQKEVKQKKAGPNTRDKVRTVQAQLGVPVEESVLLDEAAVAAIEDALKKRGLTAASRSFTVTGTVRLQDGSVRKRQQLLAFDLDLRGVATYRKVKTTLDIDKSGGFEFLGLTFTDNWGDYRLTFYDWQYRRAERKKADVVVYAVEEGKDGLHIVGRSRLVNSDDYSEKGLVQGLDITIAQTDTRTEYEKLMSALAAFLKESGTSLAEICTSGEQLAFTASELDIEPARLDIAAAAETLMQRKDRRLSHELLYGIGRQDIRLVWPVLYRRSEEELRTAIAKSVASRIIRAFEDKKIKAFLRAVRERAVREMLDGGRADSGNTLDAMLSNALPTETQRRSFLNAVATFRGSDFRDFWKEHLPAQPEFRGNPRLISNLLLTQQLALLTGNHQALVNELQVQRGLKTVGTLFDLDDSAWNDIVEKAGVPDFVQGQNDEERRHGYIKAMQEMLNAAFPTQRIARMLDQDELRIEKTKISQSIKMFLSENAQFDFAGSRIHDFKKEIEAVAGEDYDEVRAELKKIQRVFQVSTSPEAMRALMENNLHSAYTIANIPRKSFIKTYGDALGGERVAFAIHERASHISTRAEMAAMHITEYSHGTTPKCAMGESEYDAAMATIVKHLPNPTPSYAALFGSPDICECAHCRSVYGAAAYMVELLRFLWRGGPNSDGKTPLDLLAARRPDLLHLPLTCENTNTVIPYIDLANEVMEYYAANDSLTTFKGYDTGEATAEELRANPQNFNLLAYRKLKDAKYPFTLPYHQPLDVIRTYSDHLKVSRYEVMKAMNPQPDAPTAQAIAAESLRISEEEHKVLTGAAFDGTADTTALEEYFGYAAAGDLEKMSAVPEFLHRSGVAYTDLVELVKTHFINPHQGTFDFLEKVFACASVKAATIYARLTQIEAGMLDPATDADIMGALATYNTAHGANITANDFTQWVTNHLGEVHQVITLYEPESKCDLEKTVLRTVQSVYTGPGPSGISSSTWSKIHRFIRLWRKLGWTIHETDLMLAALGEDEISAGTVAKLESVLVLKAATRMTPNQLAAAWGSIDTYGKKSLYRKLFLNRAVQQIDAAFEADAWGNYLQRELDENGDPVTLAKHQSAIVAAFRMREEDLAAILSVAEVVEGGSPRLIDVNNDVLNLANLSTIYRYAMLAKALKMRITDLCKLIDVFQAAPFSTWDMDNEQFDHIVPGDTYRFCQLADSIKKLGFKAEVVEYVVKGTLAPDSRTGLDRTRILLTAKIVHDTFLAIEQNYPETPPSPLTTEILTARLALTFQPGIVARFMGILGGTASFQTVADANLDVAIPDALSRKYAYVKGSGRLICNGVMSDAEHTTLKGLANINTSFENAVDALYAAPADFIGGNLGGLFGNPAEANAKLLDHPAQAPATTLDEKLTYVYERFIPVLKQKLRRDTAAQHIAALIGLSEAATAVLIAQDVDGLITDLAREGFSGTYFSDATWTTSVLAKMDETVDFAWGAGAPDPAVPANNFSVRWEAYVAAPASGEYTLRVDVAEADEVFKLYLDDVLVLEKTSADASTSWEITTALNAAQMHLLRLEYAEISQNASVRLQWMTTTTAPEVVPASVAYPAAVLDAFVTQATLYHRAAKFISGFALSETELNHLIAFDADFGNIDFNSLTAEHWRRVSDYIALRNATPQAQALLTDVFVAANTTNPMPSAGDLKTLLYRATAWDETGLGFLVAYFGYGVADFGNEIALNRLREVMQIAARAGLSPQTIAVWGKVETDFDALNATAQLVKNAVKAKYEEQDWLNLAGALSDAIRRNQQEALVGYLLTRPAIAACGAEDADGLFEYFLIDVQMGACMDTSRIVQANASIQMFVNRCLLGLESDTSSGQETGVSPDMIDRDRWEWMKNYRVWEANRKVFLYPENWLEPEWRNDRSEFFRDLESYLVQNDITDRSVEQAFRNYLASLNDVANLDVCGMYRENYDDGQLKHLHVFARTHNAPYKFFYRRWNEYRKWSPWERVPVDIRSVETGGVAGNDNSGVQLIPVVWKERLFLFWPEFMHVQKAPGGQGNQSVEEVSDDKMSTLQATDILEIRLAWSEYVDGKWTPKQVSKEYVTVALYDTSLAEKHFLLVPRIQSTTQELTLEIWTVKDRSLENHGEFGLVDIPSPVSVLDYTTSYAFIDFNYKYHFSKRKSNWARALDIMDDVYLKKQTNHKLLLVVTFMFNIHKMWEDPENAEISVQDPFFFGDLRRTYFVRPVDISWIEGIKYPESYKPFVLQAVPDIEYHVPLNIPSPHVGPDDYIPVAGGSPEFVGGNPTDHYANSAMTRQPTWLGLPSGAAEMPFARPMMLSSGGTPTAVSSSAATPDSASAPMTMKYGGETSYTAKAFGGVKATSYGNQVPGIKTRLDTGLEFHTFYHPFSSKYVKRLNQGGIPALLGSDTENPLEVDAIKSDEGATFENAYDPNFTHGLVKRHSNFDTPPDPRTAYKENVCFDVYGANSLYNWELFFHAPLYIATRLSKNGKYEEAMKWFHYIFDPTTDEMPAAGESETSRYWKVLPFKTTPAESLENWFRSLLPNTDPNTENAIIGEWRDHPFDPHLVAGNRPLAYMKHVVIKYVENLIAWADSRFRQFQRESVNEALQIYVIANHVLGPRPEFVPKRGEVGTESYDSLKNKWDDFSNALVELENIFPYSSEASVSSSSTGTSLLGVGSALYFCIPANDKLVDHWDTVADRLYKIRHCQDIDGVERKLALFSPPIEPGALIQAASQGLSLGSILADLSSPPPIYRFTHLIQKANEFCSDVKTLGSALLAALEKKDAEELGRLRASHETQMLELMTAVRERQVLDAKANKENLAKARAAASFRLQHYIDLLGNDSVTPPPAPTISATLTADSQLPADTNIATVKTDVDESLVDSEERGIKLIPKEKKEIDSTNTARNWQIAAQASEGLAAIAHIIPTVSGDGKPFGIGAGVSWGGTQLGNALSATGKAFDFVAGFSAHEAIVAAKTASYIRREQEWTLQANLAAREIIQLDKQITSADIRIQVAQKELDNHKQQIENARQVELFLKNKFTNEELYQWMKEQLFAVYKQSYNLAYDMAKKAEKAYQNELGTESAGFIQYGYWDNSEQGLVAGEKLQLALRQMEKSYLEENRRELELTKSISLARLDPLALIELCQIGSCRLSVPETLFDLDFRGHYFRRIKSVRLSIPCVTGPYTPVSCTLRLLNNSVRINTSLEPQYEHKNEDGLWTDDDRFRTNYTPVTSIATSSAQNDSGTFEFNFRDERYLPFELSGAISEWQIELSTDPELRPFDYATISDVILHFNYTARESGGPFKKAAATSIKNFLANTADRVEQPLIQMFSLRHEFPTEWHRFLHPATVGAEQILSFTPGRERFPYFARGRDIVPMKVEVFARSTQATTYQLVLSYVDPADPDGALVTSAPLNMPQDPGYGGLNKVTIDSNAAGLNLEELDVSREIRLKLKRSTAADFTGLVTEPEEVEDIFFVVHYKLD